MGTVFMRVSICLSVSLSVSARANLRNHTSQLHQILRARAAWTGPCIVGYRFSGGVATRYVFPVLWMTLRFPIVGRMASILVVLVIVLCCITVYGHLLVPEF